MNAAEALRRIRGKRPLVHHITNHVTANLVANATLCAGALPVMAHAHQEVREMASLASALVLNIGTPDPAQIDAMLLAGKRANERGVPVVLDPVGAGATTLRTRTAERLLSELEVFAVCGNAGEVATLAGLSAEVRGVESLSGDAREAAEKAASAFGVTVAATGETDFVSDGGRTFAVEEGHPLMGRVVGSGCASTAVVGCFAAVGYEGGGAETVADALAYFGLAGEVAARGMSDGAGGPGTFEPRLLDALAELSAAPDRLGDGIRAREITRDRWRATVEGGEASGGAVPRQAVRGARLLLVTDPRPDLAARVEAAVRGGVDVVQLRDKRAAKGHEAREELLPLAEELRRICAYGGALFTVNDDVELARLSGADGVHLGQEDETIAKARESLGMEAVVGLSVSSVGQAREAVRGGADYLGVGTVFATPTKADAEVAGLALVEGVARERPPVPWFAIGGVTLGTAPEIVAAGAKGLAVVRAVLDADDPEATARELRRLLPG